MGNCVLSFFLFLFLVKSEDIFNRATETSQSITFLDILIKSPQKTKPITKYPLITFCVCVCFFWVQTFATKTHFALKENIWIFQVFFSQKNTFHKMAKFCHNTFTASSSFFIILLFLFLFFWGTKLCILVNKTCQCDS